MQSSNMVEIACHSMQTLLPLDQCVDINFPPFYFPYVTLGEYPVNCVLYLLYAIVYHKASVKKAIDTYDAYME